MTRRRFPFLLFGVVGLCLCAGCDGPLGDFISRAVPLDSGAKSELVAARYMAGDYPGTINHTLDDAVVVYHFTYTNGITLFALHELHQLTADPRYGTQVRASLRHYLESDDYRSDGGDEPIDYLGAMAHAALVHAEAHEDGALRAAALDAARYFLEDAARTPAGLLGYHEDPARGRIWADALFMTMPLLAKAGRVLDDSRYYDDVLANFRGYAERLRDPNTGLYHQGYNWHGAGASPGFWGRANGYVAVAQVEALRALPADYPGRAGLLADFRDFAAALVVRQDALGRWHQLLDEPATYAESSCTGLLTYALARGVTEGWLDASYREAARRGAEATAAFVTLDGDIENVCPGTGTQASREAYRNRGPRTNDSHGVGPVLLGLYGGLLVEEGTP